MNRNHAAALDDAVSERLRAMRARPKPLTFRGGPLAIQTTDAREFVIEGPADTTKTTALLWRLFTDLSTTPRSKGVITMRLRATMATTVLPTWTRILERRGGGVTVYGGVEPRWFDWPNGARCYVAGLDDGDKVLGGEFDFVAGSQLEQWALDPFEKLTSRVTGRGAVSDRPWLGFDCNPGPPTHWILKRARLTKFHARHEDNPELFDDLGRPTAAYEERMAPLEALTGVRKERLFFGRWVAAEGVVYEAFDRNVHLVPRAAAPDMVRHVVGIDWGYTNPGTMQVWGIDSDGRMWLVWEQYRTRQSLEWWVARGREVQKRFNPSAFICDPSEPGNIQAFTQAGLPARGAKNAVLVGIQAVEKRLQKGGDGRPRLLLVEDALVQRDEDLATAHKPVCTADEFELYRWPKDASGKALKEEPVKENDHGMDPMRYVSLELEAPATSTPMRSFARPERRAGVLG